MKKLLLPVFLFYSTLTFAQIYSSKNFVKDHYPVTEKDFENLRIHNINIHVEIVKGKLQLSEYNPKQKEYAFLNGVFLSIDRGEWGGATYYRPNDSTQKKFYINGKPDSVSINPLGLSSPSFFRYDVKEVLMDRYKNSVYVYNGPVNGMFKFKDSVYLVGEGIYSIVLKDNNFATTRKWRPEGQNVEFASVLGNQILACSTQGFYVLDKAWNATLLFDKLDLAGLYINSMVVLDKRHIYLGMRDGYAAINLPKKKLVFYRFITGNSQ